MNSRRILIAFCLALLVSGLSTWLVSRKLTARSTVKKIPDAIYVAPARSVEAGEVLKSDDTEVVAWPGGTPIEGALAKAADVIGREALFPLGKGQPILDRELSAPGSGTGLASKVPDGMRAVALRSDEVVGVAGFLIPGSHLDVLVTYRPDSSPEAITATVLENVVVLAAGHQIEPDPTGKASDVAIVTLLLTPEESQRAVLASSQGAIHFVLRNGGDNSLSGNHPIQISQLAGGPAAPLRMTSARPAVAAKAQPARTEIETVLGGGAEARPAGGSGQ